jgi:type IV secretion system protein TrbL
MGVCSLPGVHYLCSAGSSVVSGVAGDFIQTAATDAANAANSILQTLVTAWTHLPVQLGGAQAGAATSLIQGDLRGVEVWAGVVGVLVAAARMALSRRGEPLRQAASGLLNMIVIGGAGALAINLFATAGDELSNYLLQNGFGQANAAFDLGLAAGFAPFLLLILAILAIVSLLVQVALVILRSALLVVLAGVWPVAAAASMTSAGAQWFRRLNGWVVALLLYKPAAAVCYAAAFELLSGTAGGGTSVIAQIEGVVLIVLATLTLPALLRFVVPLTSSLGGFSAGEVLATGAAVAAGAAAVVATAGAAAPAAGGLAGGLAGGGATAATAGPSGSALAGSAGAGGGSPFVLAPGGANGRRAAGVRDAAQGFGQAANGATGAAEQAIAGEGEDGG